MSTSSAKQLQIWDLWIPDVAAVGISFARGRLDPTDTLLVHAAPEKLTVEVRDDHGHPLAFGLDLPRTLVSPIARLRRDGDCITREDLWPTDADHGSLVILPGGEVGTLLQWWNAPDRSEWRWQVEFYNHR